MKLPVIVEHSCRRQPGSRHNFKAKQKFTCLSSCQVVTVSNSHLQAQVLISEQAEQWAMYECSRKMHVCRAQTKGCGL